ncbi:MAG: VanZ family protein [Verrucomicrobiae bacterium]|nr:VanZ family protein [Verrucomicrobiae bacterium]
MNAYLSWLPAAGWATAIFVISSLPSAIPPEEKPLLWVVPTDALAHAIAYCLLAALVLFALRRGHRMPLPVAVIVAIVMASAYGVTDEWHQSFVPGRTASVADWIADAVGAALAGCIWCLYESRRSRQTNR